jgi:hypothetical protein
MRRTRLHIDAPKPSLSLRVFLGLALKSHRIIPMYTQTEGTS